MNGDSRLLHLKKVIGMELTGSDDQRFTVLHLMEIRGLVVLIYYLGFHLDGQEGVPWIFHELKVVCITN